MECDCVKRLNELDISAKRYFNAVLMLLNLGRLRLNNVFDDLILMAEKYVNKLCWMDQYVLNIFLLEKWEQLLSNYKDLVKPLKTIAVIGHYEGFLTPWCYLNNYLYKSFTGNIYFYRPLKTISISI